jgi:hypothetical protein
VRELLRRSMGRWLKLAGWRQDALFGDVDAYNDLIGNEFAEHLLSVVGGFQDRGNLRAFECCVRTMPAGGAVVEIGAFLGLSTNLISYALHRYGRDNRFFTCDPWVFAGSDKPKADYFSTASPDYRQWVMQLFKMNTSLFSRGREPFAIEGTSRQFFSWWSECATVQDLWGRQIRLGGPISFAYVDGAHTYPEVSTDLRCADAHLLPGGLVFLDDSADAGSYDGVKMAVADLARGGRFDLVLKTPNYCFRKKHAGG